MTVTMRRVWEWVALSAVLVAIVVSSIAVMVYEAAMGTSTSD